VAELAKILKDESWLESEKRGAEVPLSDKQVFDRAVKIWEEQNEKLVKKEMDHCSI
jgi:hypothetical protein